MKCMYRNARFVVKFQYVDSISSIDEILFEKHSKLNKNTNFMSLKKLQFIWLQEDFYNRMKEKSRNESAVNLNNLSRMNDSKTVAMWRLVLHAKSFILQWDIMNTVAVAAAVRYCSIFLLSKRRAEKTTPPCHR